MKNIDLKEFASKVFEKGRDLGFEEMEVYYVDSDSFEVKVYNKEIDAYNVNTSRGLSFRGLLNGKMAYSFTEKFEDEDIDYLVNIAKENVQEVEIEGEEFIFEGSESYHPSFESKYQEVDAKIKIQDAIKLEELGYSKDERIESVQHCILQTAKGSRRIINTKGLDLSDSSGGSIAYLSLVAKDEESVKSGSSFKIVEDYSKLNFDDIAKEATDETISKIGGESISTGKYKVIFRYDVVSDMLSTFSSIFSADAVHKGLSLLKNKISEKIASDCVNIIDNPFLEAGGSKCTFDDEGVATYNKILVENGVLKSYLHNLKTSKKDGVDSTGNGFKASYKSPVDISPTYMYIEKGSRSLEEITSEINEGLIITQLQGLHSGASPVSGDFSLAALGQYIKNGKVVSPVEQITVSGNFYTLLKDIEEVASDFKLSNPSGAGGFGSASILIKEINISGK